MTESNWDEASRANFWLRIFVCGYEQRASFIASRHLGCTDHTLILDYQCRDTLHYEENRHYFSTLPNSDFVAIDDDLRQNLQKSMKALLTSRDDTKRRILFDVSSCSRSVMATVLLVLNELSADFHKLEVSCAYALSAFAEPPNGELPSHISEPIVGDLAGWSVDLSRPPCAVIGLGFEPGRALGCIDYLEMPEIRLFLPRGADSRFEDAVKEANSVLIQEAGDRYLLPYEVLEPSATFQKMESLLHGLVATYRPVLIPLGPKIFAALSIVLAIKMLPSVCVWRTSSGGLEIVDRRASGDVAVFTTTLGPVT